MMSELTRLRDEAERLLSTYVEYRDCNDEDLRRKVHVDLDRFLMENRETVMILTVTGLSDEIQHLIQQSRDKHKESLLDKLRRKLKKDKTRKDNNESNDEDEFITDPDEPKWFNN